MPSPAFRNISIAFLCFFGILSSSSTAQPKTKQWIYFIDKGPSVPSFGSIANMSREYREAAATLDPRALARRAKVLPLNSLVDAADLPIYEPYLENIKNLGGVIIQQSRWINAATVFLSKEEISRIEKLPFVEKVKPVVVIRMKQEPEKEYLSATILRKEFGYDYGQSNRQIQMINVVPLHTAGITGKGVLVGMLDSGFRWRAHEALQTRHVVTEHDFIFNDDVTANQSGDSKNQDEHGTLTFSILGGFKPGKLIGPAFGADFILGKTEYVPTEYRREEDYWAAGIEWMENHGVDVVSSSVGYNLFDDGTGYLWSNGDFNGRTSVVAQAAARAARLGVVVCTSMGNEGRGDGITGTLLTPADADSIISVGAVTFSRILADFSSTGPTNDNRTKPDLVAPGVGIYHATVPGPDTYGASNGNSVSTPLVAGSAALLLSARPELTPIEVIDALRNTAEKIDTLNHPAYPNNFTGWGLIDAFKAAIFFGPIFSNEPLLSAESGEMLVSIDVISEYGIRQDSVFLYSAIGTNGSFQPDQMALDSPAYFPTSGKYSAHIPVHPIGTPIRFYIEAHDSGGHSYKSPSPARAPFWWLHYGIPDLQPSPVNETGLTLYQNYPNPFHSAASFPGGWIPGNITVVQFDLPKEDNIIMKVYNFLGGEVATIASGFYNRGIHSVIWDASNNPSGVYLCRISGTSGTWTKKMIYVR